MRKRHKWVEKLATYAIGLLAYLTGFPSAVYVHEHARQWEAAAVLISLGLGILPGLWYWRTRRFGWLAAILSSALLMFSFVCALFHGWETQALALISVATIAITVAIFVGISRATRRFESAMRTIGEELDGDPLFRRETLFRDDGQRITVYPRRRTLALRGAAQLVVLAAIGCVFAFLSIGNLLLWLGLVLSACFLIATFLATVYRLVVHKPALVVGPDGIFDDGSLTWSGVGLLRWDEVLFVSSMTTSTSWVKNRFLVIMVADLPGIRRRLPRLKRLALSNTYSRMSQLLIGQAILETPVADLAEQIARYVDTHAPPGWRAGEAEDGEPTPDTDDVEA